MSELISELYALAQRMAAAGEIDEPVTVSLAAEEIERLQQQNDYLSALASGQPLYGLEEKIADLMQRNKALREEVERLQKTVELRANPPAGAGGAVVIHPSPCPNYIDGTCSAGALTNKTARAR